MNQELKQLDEQIAELQQRRAALFNQLKPQALEQARRIVEDFNLTASQIGLTSMSRKPLSLSTPKRPVTFYDPNTGRKWDGALSSRGRKPDWIKEAISNGTVEHFRVQLVQALPAN